MVSDDIVNFEVGPTAAHGHVVDDAIMWFDGEANRETCAFCAAQPMREPCYAMVTKIDRELGIITISSQESGKDVFSVAPSGSNIHGGKDG